MSNLTSTHPVGDIEVLNDEFEFTINDNSSSFCIYIFGEKEDKFALSLQSPDGTRYPKYENRDNYLNLISKKNIIGSVGGIIGFSLPINNSPSEVKGRWKGQINANKGNIPRKVTIVQKDDCTDNVVERWSLSIYPYIYVLTGINSSIRKNILNHVNESLKKTHEIMMQSSVALEFGDPVFKDMPDGGISEDFRSVNTANAVNGCGNQDGVAVLFVQDMKPDQNSPVGQDVIVDGVSGYTPGPQGFVNNFSGVLIRITTKANDPIGLSSKMLSHTLSHELCHYLGLVHSNSSKNLMYESTNVINNKSVIYNDLDAPQVSILQSQPISIVHYSGRRLSENDKTAVISLSVIIATGDAKPSKTDPDNADIIVAFALGLDADDNQAWSLLGDAGNFSAGAETKFDLEDLSDLYMEDLKFWAVSVSWTSINSNPMLFITPDNAWDFRRITIIANGTTIYDDNLNLVLFWPNQLQIMKTIGG